MRPTGTGPLQDAASDQTASSETPLMKPGSRPSRFALWRNRDFMLLWSGQVVSNIGTQVSQLAFPLFILALTRSPALAGLAGALRAIPYLLLSLPIGVLIDRRDRKRVMIICDTARALVLASIPLAFALGHLTALQLFVVTAAEGTLYVFFNLAEVACLPRVVPRHLLPEATAQNEATFGITALIGPPLGGLLFQIGNVIPFLGDAISYACSVISLFFIKTGFQETREATRRNLWQGIYEGLHWLWTQPLIRFMAILTGGLNLTNAGYTLLVIVLAQEKHSSSVTIGLIFTIGSFGAIAGTIIGPFLQKRLSFGRVIISTVWLFAFSMPLYLIVPNVMMIGAVTAIELVGGPIYNVVQLSYRSALIPDALQGRVNSVFRLIAFGSIPLGAALTGLAIQDLGVAWTILIDTLILLVLALATTLNTHVRHAQPITQGSTTA